MGALQKGEGERQEPAVVLMDFVVDLTELLCDRGNFLLDHLVEFQCLVTEGKNFLLHAEAHYFFSHDDTTSI